MEETRGLAGTIMDMRNKELQQNDMLKSLEQEAILHKLIKDDPGMSDATIQMLVMAQGPKAFSYLMPEVTAAGRMTNAIKESDISRLIGIPRTKDMQAFTTSNASRDKVLWTLTGNGIKGGGLADRINNDEQ